MKTAITSTGNSGDDLMDRHFGRCPYFVIFDDEYQSVEFIPNPNKGNLEDAGSRSVELLHAKNVRKVVSGEFGTRVKSLFDAHQIQLIILPGPKKIAEIIKIIREAG